MTSLMAKLPEANREIIEHIILVCKMTDQNPLSKMKLKSLSVVVGATLLLSRDPAQLRILRTTMVTFVSIGCLCFCLPHLSFHQRCLFSTLCVKILLSFFLSWISLLTMTWCPTSALVLLTRFMPAWLSVISGVLSLGNESKPIEMKGEAPAYVPPKPMSDGFGKRSGSKVDDDSLFAISGADRLGQRDELCATPSQNAKSNESKGKSVAQSPASMLRGWLKAGRTHFKVMKSLHANPVPAAKRKPFAPLQASNRQIAVAPEANIASKEPVAPVETAPVEAEEEEIFLGCPPADLNASVDNLGRRRWVFTADANPDDADPDDAGGEKDENSLP